MDRYVGKRLDGRYEIKEIIGVGGMAVVYKAFDNQENRIVAIKILKEEFISNEEFLRRFKNESKAIAMLSHPNIVKVYDVSFGDLIQYIVMEYIEGITLKEFIEQEGSLRWKDAVHFTMQILKGLQHAHDKGIVHRDVKPQNIMVLSDGTIKVTDFGIARFARSDQRTITDKAIGSVHYISPEQARGEKTDEKTDIYSVGVMLYEMLTGKLPFQAESAVSVALMQLQRDPQLPTEINGSIPQGLEQITMHAMQKTPERRYQSASEMLCELNQFRKDPSITFDHSYFVDNSPTKFVSDIPSNEIDLDEEPEETEVKEKSSIIPILSGIAAALVVALIVLAIIFVPKFFKGTGEEIECPNFVGKTIEEIKTNPDYVGKFDLEEKWDYNDDFAYGIVYEQSEAAGKKIKKDTITLYISMGQSTIKVEDVYDKPESEAVSILKSQKFKTVITKMAHDEVEEGHVIKTEPQRTEVVAQGATITIYVSTGKATKEVAVPNIVGIKVDDAKKRLEKENLIPEVEEVLISNGNKFYPVGVVIAQDSESSKVPEGSKVTIKVCKGYTTDITIPLPKDFVTETYYVTLWKDGKKVHSGDKVNSLKLSNYTFKGLQSEESNFKVTVMISSNGEEEENLYDISVDINKGTVNVTYEYKDYSKYVPDENVSDYDSDYSDSQINGSSNAPSSSSLPQSGGTNTSSTTSTDPVTDEPQGTTGAVQ